MLETDLVFNLVWTGGVYRYQRYFFFSLLDQTECRFRFIANNCTPDSVAQMRAFAAAAPERVVEVIELPHDRMVPHGTALDHVLDHRDDGELFCFIDVDIKATGPFVKDFLDTLDGCDVVTSGIEVWTDNNQLAPGEPGVGGRHFYAADGFVFGSPHFSIYRRAVIDAVRDHWGVGFAVGGDYDMSPEAWARLQEMGQAYMAYDTAKVFNILLQADGHSLVHEEHPALLHIGGLSHYLAPPQFDFATDRTDGEYEGEPKWTEHAVAARRADVARYTAAVLRALAEGRPAPPIPEGYDPATLERVERVRPELISMVADTAPWARRTDD